MRHFLIACFVCINLLAFGQKNKPSTKRVEKEIAAYLQSAEDSLLTNLTHTIRASQRAIDLAKSNGLPQWEQKCYLTLVGFYERYQKVDFMVKNYDRAIALGLANTNRLHYQKLPYLEQLTDTTKAIRDANQIAKIARKEGNREEESNAFIVLGNIYGKAGNHQKSLQYLEKADQLVSENNPQQRARVQGYIGDGYNNLNQNVKAESYYRNSITYGNEAKDTTLMVANFDRLNDIYVQEKRNSDIIALNNTVVNRGVSKSTPKDTVDLQIKDKKNDFWVPKVQSQAGLNLASAHLDNNSNAEAIDILEDLNRSIPKQDLKQNSEVHKLLSKAYDQSGKYAQALEEYKAYVALQDSLLKQKDLKIEASLQKNIELQELENHVLFLEKDKELDAKTIALNESNIRRQQTIIFAAFAIALIILLSLIVVIRKNRAKTAANNLLELKSLRTKMNPHFIFNSLNSVNHFIAQSDEKAANKYLGQFSKLMRDVLDSSDKDFISLDKEVDLLQVYLALEHQRFANKFEYTLEIDPETRSGDYSIPPMLVQPFIENAIWHGLRYIDYPGRLAVRIFQKSEHLMIEIEDNGIGREASRALKTKSQNQHQSSGISNSKNRIDLTNKVYGESISIDIVDKTDDPDVIGSSGTLVQISIKNRHGN
jgi:hypothetical protein